MKSTMAFTLIELLVVVTIIVILLALLVPGMERAIYQAELMSCGTRLKSVATGAVAYAVANKQAYPHRPGHIMAAMLYSNGGHDLRPVIESYIPIQMLNDPLCDEIPLNRDETPAGMHVNATYALRFGWGFTPAGGGMRKLGARWSWTDNSESGTSLRHDFKVIASDRDRLILNTHYLGSHPDKGGQAFLDNQADGGGENWVLIRWRINGTHLRRKVDMNFAYEDGSVSRLSDVSANAPNDAGTRDERMARVPNYDNGHNWPNEWHNVPKQ